MSDLSKKDRGCWLAFGHAPEGTKMRAANDALNAYVADEARGLALFHDHFADRPGGVAVFAVETAAELAALGEPGPLAGWDLHLHPLIFANSALRFPFQIDYTMSAYRGRRFTDLMAEYTASDLAKGIAASS